VNVRASFRHTFEERVDDDLVTLPWWREQILNYFDDRVIGRRRARPRSR
jgi:hypothetical protein